MYIAMLHSERPWLRLGVVYIALYSGVSGEISRVISIVTLGSFWAFVFNRGYDDRGWLFTKASR